MTVSLDQYAQPSLAHNNVAFDQLITLKAKRPLIIYSKKNCGLAKFYDKEKYIPIYP